VAVEVTGGSPRVRICTGQSELDGDDVSAVLYRHVRLATAPQIEDPEARRLAESELRYAFDGALLSLDAFWLNHPHANRLARHKPLQLVLASEEGPTVPETRITADPVEIRDLFSRWDGRMIAKLVAGPPAADSPEDMYVVFTSVVTQADLGSDAALSACPTTYQRLVEKAFDLRVTLVGERAFGCRIHSQERADARIDWRARRGDLRVEACEVEPQLADRCRSLARRLGVEFAGMDFVVTPEGEAVFLEVNAAGQWAWFQENAGLPIAEAIAARLMEAPARTG
jgi:glutathione synthase/RimK-type ligase-like ATP-grasp enzyme